MEKLEKFRALGLSENTLAAIEKKGFEEPSPIQEKTIPLLLHGKRDIIAQSQTGTGKTAAFGLPIIERIDERSRDIQALVLVPTRELAIQVSEEIASFKGNKRIDITAIYGGASMSEQLRRLRKGVHIVVGTPGRILDHIGRGTLILDKLTHVVLDEADEMLNMGFVEDIEEILESTPSTRQMLLFSATMPHRIKDIAKKFMKDQEFIGIPKQQLTATLTDQIYFEVSSRDKFEALSRIIDIEKDFYGLIFCRTRVGVDELASKLSERGYAAEGLHGDISQHLRERILNKFRKKSINILVATDVAARGIDINDLTHVINHSLPQDPEAYVHRIGRTGRAGKHGTAITFVTPDEYRKLLYIQKVAKTEIRKEKLPNVKEMIAIKKERLKVDINTIIDSNDYNDYSTMANDLLDQKDPQQVIAALLKYSFQDQLNESKYKDIQEARGPRNRNIDVEKDGKVRLFLALGKNDDMTTGEILNLIDTKAGVKSSSVKDIQIFDKFSFMNVPFEEAEQIIKAFKKDSQGRRPIFEKAQDSKGGRGGDRGGRSRDRDGGRDRSSRDRDRGSRSGDRDRGGRSDRSSRSGDRDRGRRR